ncbi:Putative type II and III secretion system protein [Candidatus Bealeia paramacronuclearis]|uniref:Type II and III secretion system protein n=1 Tax=Candidatus Bealeia paramacronuclearis TaxID=1921001 RepID=A0ABZ2C8F9_9PROT|nr:putative type II and III secretion system protein [Candidatus Bealeia paramacronuclearis]
MTPLKLEGDYVTLEIRLDDSFLEDTEVHIAARAASNTPLVFSVNVSNVSTTIKARLGETIMLGGTVQRTEVASTDRVPGIGSIPLIQYLFSNETSLSEHQSVMYLITPRARQDVRDAAKNYLANRQGDEERPTLAELERRHPDWTKPEKNVVPILKALTPLYYDYRAGDISPLNWGTPEDFLGEQLNVLSRFLWY